MSEPASTAATALDTLTLVRLFPHAPEDTPRWRTLLWATGRAALPGHPRLGEDWRWFSAPR